MTNCTNCNAIIAENYCPNCGQVAVLKRISWYYLQHEFMHLFHLEKGFIYTVKQLVSKPGESIRVFLEQNRNKLMKPIPFLVFTSLIFALAGSFFDPTGINNSIGKITVQYSNSYASKILMWFHAHYAYANIITSLFIALLIKILYRKYNYNYFEILTLLFFIYGINMLFMSILVLFYGIINTLVFKILFSIFYYGYSVFAIAQFFDKSKVLSYVKAFLAFLFGLVLYFIATAFTGVGIDQLLK
jgi:Protein of unknown function (DUF3667)